MSTAAPPSHEDAITASTAATESAIEEHIISALSPKIPGWTAALNTGGFAQCIEETETLYENQPASFWTQDTVKSTLQTVSDKLTALYAIVKEMDDTADTAIAESTADLTRRLPARMTVGCAIRAKKSAQGGQQLVDVAYAYLTDLRMMEARLSGMVVMVEVEEKSFLTKLFGSLGRKKQTSL